MDIRMLGKPSVAFLMRAIIVEYHMKFLILGGLADDLIHELQKIFSALEFRGA